MKEETILTHLVCNDQYARKVHAFLKPEYFSGKANLKLFQLISRHVDKYSSFPSKEALGVDLLDSTGLTEEEFKSAKSLIFEMKRDAATNQDWLLDETEKFCQFKAITNAIVESLHIIEGSEKETRTPAAIPQMLQDALAVSFSTSIGHDYFDDAAIRYDYYHAAHVRLPFDLRWFNTITRGGIIKKSLTVAMASTGVGKTHFMCHCAAHNLLMGKNVLYITLEMPKEQISARIDENLMNVTRDELFALNRASFDDRLAKIKEKTKGKLIVEEYPPSSISAAHIRHLVRELKVKKGFVPDVIYVDYLNECVSSHMKMGGSVNSYLYYRAIAKELRGLGVEFDIPIFTATQSNRGGYESTDVGLDDVSDSFGVPAVADLMFVLIQTEEMRAQRQVMVKQLKNRYGPLTPLRFLIGSDQDRMKFFDLDDRAQVGLSGGPEINMAKPPPQAAGKDFSSFSV